MQKNNKSKKKIDVVANRLPVSISRRKDGREALNISEVRPESLDLVITDHLMPEISGAELGQKFSEIRHKIPIVLCTGFDDKIDKKRIKKKGILGIILKAADTNEIAQYIRRIFDEG